MRFGVHFLKHVFMIHIRFELKGKVGRRRVAIVAKEKLMQRKTSEVGRLERN